MFSPRGVLIKMANWFIFAIGALIFWGLWGFFRKITTNYMSPKSIVIYELIGVAVIVFILLWGVGFKPDVNKTGIALAVITGAIGVIGTLLFSFALTKGSTTSVAVTAGLYPILIIFLAFFVLKEPITAKQGFGVVLALIAMTLFSI
jgi:transporter family protein